MRRRLAIDIDEARVTAVLHRGVFRGRELLASACVETTAGLDSALDRLLAEIGNSVGSLSPAALPVDCAIPLAEASLRFLRFPFSDRRKIAKILPLELENQLPWSHDAVLADFMVVRRDNSGCEVLAAALPRTRAMYYQETLARHGLHPGRLLLSPLPVFALLRSLSLLPDDSVLLWRTGTTVVVALAARGHLAALRSLHTSDGHETTIRLPQGLGLILKGAQARGGGAPPPAVVVAIGWEKKDVGLAEAIQQRLAVPVRWLDREGMLSLFSEKPAAWRGLTAPLDIRLGGCLALAAGNGGRRSPGFALESPAGSGISPQLRRKFVSASVILAGLILLAGGNAVLDRALLLKRLSLLDGRIRRMFYQVMPVDAKLVDPVLQLQTLLAARVGQGNAAGAGAPRGKVLDVLLAVSANMTGGEQMTLSSLYLDREEIQLRGEAATFNGVDAFKARLEKEETIVEATITAADMNAASGRVLFEMRLKRRPAAF